MKLQFKPHQQHQIDAVESVSGLFEGHARVPPAPSMDFGTGLAAVPNGLLLDPTTLLSNLQSVQERNGLSVDSALQMITEIINGPAGEEQVDVPNFSVEMETGTGKTYVYVRTALALSTLFGWQKFIVVVPSVAVREGVLKTLQITRDHFRDIFEGIPYRFYTYDANHPTRVRQFALSNSVEFMVMTIDSFNKAANVMRQPSDRLQGETPLHLVQATRPILILDEPQNMESEKAIAALASLHPLFTLRYSATHRNPYNLCHRLTPFEAYRQGLVKRIEVASVLQDGDSDIPFLRVDAVTAARRTASAKIALRVLQRSGAIKEKVLTVKPGDDLSERANRSEYDGFVVDEINAGGQFVRFTNNVELSVGKTAGLDRAALFEAQIAYTIEEHFRKQERLRDQGIKVLSLFFIDRVDNYQGDDPVIRHLFDAAFDRLRDRFPEWASYEASDVQAAYFAARNRRGGERELIDSTSGESDADQAAYDLIMRHKEKLLSFEEPVAFIFSHSALREGWDNPNVFQICTLNESGSEVRKRQEIGRGVRICVDQEGEQVLEPQVNRLTVIANESYERYVAQLQAEVVAEYGTSDVAPPPPDARKRRMSKLKKARVLSPEFKELWSKVQAKTRYRVTIDRQALLDDVVPLVDNIAVKPLRVSVSKAEVRVDAEDFFDYVQTTGVRSAVDLTDRYPLPNVVDLMAQMLENSSPPMRLTRSTLLEVVRRTGNWKAMRSNPLEFASAASRLIKSRLADHLVLGIQYERTGDTYDLSLLASEVESWEDHFVASPHSLYDSIVVDSNVEREFVKDLERRADVRLYVKLPAWFKVATPVGNYNPDWAIVVEDRDEHGDATGADLLYLVRETKGAGGPTKLRDDERRKIVCGDRHFNGALGTDYDVVSKADELPAEGWIRLGTLKVAS